MINYFAGDYGLRMLYYRNFIGTPSAPGEMTVTFSFRDYLVAFRSGITLMTNRFFPFLLSGNRCGGTSLEIVGERRDYDGLRGAPLRRASKFRERWFCIFI
jgi:hypothetical protein